MKNAWTERIAELEKENEQLKIEFIEMCQRWENLYWKQRENAQAAIKILKDGGENG